MRYLYGILIILVTIAVLIFMAQNLQSVTVSFLAMRITLPLFILVLLVYILGMSTGSSLSGLLRSWFQGIAKRHEESKDEEGRS